MSPLAELRRPWLADFGWPEITEANAALCSKTASFHGPTSDGHEDGRAFWEARFLETMTFREALEVLRRSHRLAPFCFNNGNTFAAVARELVFELSLASEISAIIRSAAGHYVAGVLPDDELDAILTTVRVEA